MGDDSRLDQGAIVMHRHKDKPDGWRQQKLGSLLSLEYGDGLPGDARRPGPYPVFGSNGQVGSHSEKLVDGPGIVVGRKGSVGEVVWVDIDFWPIDTTYFVKPKTQHSLRWLYYLLKSRNLRRLNSATGVPGLNRNDAYALKVDVPPNGESHGIAKILLAIDTAIERTRAVIEQVRVVKQALLADLMTNGLPGRHKKFKTVKHIGRLPESWDDETVGALAADRKAICYGVVQPGRHVADGTPFIRVNDIDGGVVATNGLKRIDPAISAQYTRSLLDGGELLVTLVGAIGRCAVAPLTCRGFNIARAVGKVPLRSSINARFVMHALNSTRNAALIGGSFESARMTLNLDQLVRVRVPIPEIDEQDSIVEIVDTVIAREQTEVKTLGQLSNIKAALSDALLTGRVRVPHTEGEATQ